MTAAQPDPTVHDQCFRHTTVSTPVGPVMSVRRGAALTGIYFVGHSPAPAPARLGLAADDGFDRIRTELDEYFAGTRRSFDIEVAADGTAFQQSVWAALRTIPYGETWTYSDLARAIGKPSSVRAVAAANARNPVSIVIPCHRVVGMGGSLTGYAGGIARKRTLLDLESAAAGSELPTLFS